MNRDEDLLAKEPRSETLTSAFRREAQRVIDRLDGNVELAALRMGLTVETLNAWIAEGDAAGK